MSFWVVFDIFLNILGNGLSDDDQSWSELCKNKCKAYAKDWLVKYLAQNSQKSFKTGYHSKSTFSHF